jgi:hypothetical protein
MENLICKSMLSYLTHTLPRRAVICADTMITGKQQVRDSHMTDVEIYLDLPGTNSALTSGAACRDAVAKAQQACKDLGHCSAAIHRDQTADHVSPQGEMSCSPTGTVLMEGKTVRKG